MVDISYLGWEGAWKAAAPRSKNVKFHVSYTIRLLALFGMIAVCSYSCAWHNVEAGKQDAAMMKTCMDAGRAWKVSNWNRDLHWCE